MPNKTQFAGRWVHWDGTIRVEQELFADGRFEGVVIDEEGDEIVGKAHGTWEVVEDAIHWRYLGGENLPIPKKVEVNPIVRIEKHRFDLREKSRRCTDWYRQVESEETSTNFDSEDVRPFLERIARFIDSGFSENEIAALMNKLKRLKPEQTHQAVFSISYGGVVSPFRIRIFMDDVDAPDLYVYAPRKLARQIDKEINRLDG